MSTRSYICVELSKEDKKFFNTDKQYVGVYCHWDGYIINGVGETLLKHYNTYLKALRLIKRGEIQGLEETLKLSRFFKPKNKVVFKEDLFFFNNEELFAKETFSMISYVYIFHPYRCVESGWNYYRHFGNNLRCLGPLKNLAHFKNQKNKKKVK